MNDEIKFRLMNIRTYLLRSHPCFDPRKRMLLGRLCSVQCKAR